MPTSRGHHRTRSATAAITASSPSPPLVSFPLIPRRPSAIDSFFRRSYLLLVAALVDLVYNLRYLLFHRLPRHPFPFPYPLPTSDSALTSADPSSHAPHVPFLIFGLFRALTHSRLAWSSRWRSRCRTPLVLFTIGTWVWCIWQLNVVIQGRTWLGEQPEGGGVDGEDQRVWTLSKKERRQLVAFLGYQAGLASVEAVSVPASHSAEQGRVAHMADNAPLQQLAYLLSVRISPLAHSSFVQGSRSRLRASSHARDYPYHASPRWAQATTGDSVGTRHRPIVDDPTGRTRSPSLPSAASPALLHDPMPASARLATALAMTSDDGPLRRRSGSGTFARASHLQQNTSKPLTATSRLSLTRSRSPASGTVRHAGRSRSNTMPSLLSSPLATAQPAQQHTDGASSTTDHGGRQESETDFDADDTEPPLSHDTSDLSSDHADIFDRYSSSDDLAAVGGVAYDSDALSAADSLSSDEIIDMPPASSTASPFGSLGRTSSTPFSRWRDRVLSAPDMIQSQSHLPILGGDHRRLGAMAAVAGNTGAASMEHSTVDRERRDRRGHRQARRGRDRRGTGAKSSRGAVLLPVASVTAASLREPRHCVEEV